jgi:hypothetical protein
MGVAKWFLLPAIGASLASQLHAQTVRTIDLKPFIGQSPIEAAKAEWAMPRGHQVLDGTPFEINGAIFLYATNSGQEHHPGRTNVANVLVGQRFEHLHLLTATDTNNGPDRIPIAKVRLLYADGSDSALDLTFGEHMRGWQGPWHKKEPPLSDPTARMAWYGQHSSAAQGDRYLRLYHVTLPNPSPDKEVRAVSLESARSQYGLMLMALSYGPAKADPLPDTWTPPKSPFPDLRPRNGDPATGDGLVRTITGTPVEGAHVRVMGARGLTYGDGRSTTDDPGIGSTADTDVSGHFTLPPLPNNRLYRLMAFAPGFTPAFFRGEDPMSDPIEIRLVPGGMEQTGGKYSVHARVTGPDGKPLPYAMVEPDGVALDMGRRSWGGSQGFSSEVLPDTNGEFTVSRNQPFEEVRLSVSASGLAMARVWLAASNDVQTIEMGVGAVIRGRVVKDGKPLATMRVGLVGAGHTPDSFDGTFSAETDTNGVFAFHHLPPDTGWELFGRMDSFRKYGSLPSRLVQSDGHGETNDAGDLAVEPGIKLSGRVQSRNGEPLPEGLRLRAGYRENWDSETADVDDHGKFNFDGLPRTLVAVSLDERGWHLTGANRSLDMWSGSQLVGHLDEDKDDLLLEVEKGELDYNYAFNTFGLPSSDMPESRPLYGAEPSGPPPQIIAGRVLDESTGKPVPSGRVIPGYQPPTAGPTGMRSPPTSMLRQMLGGSSSKGGMPWMQRAFWRMNAAEPLTNGGFSLDFLQLSCPPVIRVEADGYEPFESDAINTNTSNLVIRLSRGTGPAGVVLLVDGRPAASAIVVYAAAHEQLGLEGKQMQVYPGMRGRMDRQSEQTTGGDGRFSFQPTAEGATIFVSHAAGWAEAGVEKGGGSLKLQLKPWAAVSGALVDSNGVPVAGVQLAITMMHDWQTGSAMINEQKQVKTDAQGRFQFDDVPPRRIEIQRLIPMGGATRTVGGTVRMGGGWTYKEQTWLVVEPGITNDLGKITLDTPPPIPLMERMKQQFGL